MHDQWSGPDLDSLLGKGSLTRRQMMMTTLAVGFAAATLPVSADTVISTSAEGLVAGEVKIPVTDGEIPAYRARPAKGRPSRWCWWCRRSSACTSTSRTSAAASRRTATARSRRSCTRGRATCRR